MFRHYQRRSVIFLDNKPGLFPGSCPLSLEESGISDLLVSNSRFVFRDSTKTGKDHLRFDQHRIVDERPAHRKQEVNRRTREKLPDIVAHRLRPGEAD